MSDEEEVERLMKVLRTAMRLLDLSNREIERRLGLTPSYLSRLFGGYIELKMEHVLSIARAIGLQPAEFFALAYPRPQEPPSEAFHKIQTASRDLQPLASVAAAEPTLEELDRRILESVRRIFKELADGR
jgi:transcriptional regulator with XRE-family HTH domain